MQPLKSKQRIGDAHRVAGLWVGVLCCFLAVAGTPAAHAGEPSITWSPSEIAITIGNGAGVTKDQIVTVTSSRALTNVDLRVGEGEDGEDDEVGPFLSVEPSHFATMAAGTAYQVKVHYTIPPGAAPGTYDETVHVRVGSETIPHTLEVEIHLDYGNILIPPSTHVLSSSTTRYLTSVAADSLTFSTETGQLRQLAPGDVVVIGITPLTPGGLLRKVTGLQFVGGQVIVTTTAAALADAIQTGSLQISENLAPPSSTSAAAMQTGVSLTAQALALTGFYLEIKDVVLYDADGNPATTNDQITANGSISLDPHIDFALDFQTKHVSFVITTTQSAQIEIKSEVELGSLKKKYQIARYPLDPMIVWVGWVPVVAQPVLSFNVGVDGNVSVGITAGVTEQVTAKAGVAYDNGSWSTVSGLSPITITPNPPTLSAGCDFKGYAGLQFSLLLYGVAGPYAEGDVYLNLKADLFATPWWELYGGFEVGVGVRVAVLDHGITDYYYPAVIGYRRLLLQATTPPPLPVTNGLNARYYAASIYVNDNWGNTGTPATTRTDQTINFNWQPYGPDPRPSGIGGDFSADWTGCINVPSNGVYTFATYSDDGSIAYIDNNVVVNNGGAHAPARVAGAPVTLTRGFHPITVKYWECCGGPALVTLLWAVPGGAEAVVPASALFTSCRP